MILNVADTSARYTKTKETWSSLRRFHLVMWKRKERKIYYLRKTLIIPIH